MSDEKGSGGRQPARVAEDDHEPMQESSMGERERGDRRHKGRVSGQTAAWESVCWANSSMGEITDICTLRCHERTLQHSCYTCRSGGTHFVHCDVPLACVVSEVDVREDLMC